nr:2-dehydro-3-deoxygalactonokinase [Glaciibacter superstes]
MSAPGLLHDYFAIRAEVVARGAARERIRERLSGLLIGYEAAQAK